MHFLIKVEKAKKIFLFFRNFFQYPKNVRQKPGAMGHCLREVDACFRAVDACLIEVDLCLGFSVILQINFMQKK